MNDLSQRINALSPESLALLSRRIGQKAHEQPRTEDIPPRDEAGDCPLSFAQERLWFLDQLSPGNAAYVITGAAHLAGRLDVASLEHALNALVGRHEILRTSFPAVDGRPVQVVATGAPLALGVVDLDGQAACPVEEWAARFADEEERRPFDLTRGPLLRVSLLRLGIRDHVLLFCMHHIVSDGWSMGIFIRELAGYYQASLLGRPPSSMPDLPIQYGDFAVWQRRRIQGQLLEGELGYWRNRLRGAPTRLDFPTDHPRPSIQRNHGAAHAFVLSAELTRSIKSLSQRLGVTPFMTLLAAFATLLSRHSGQEDIVVGTGIANRNRAALEPLIGYFINTLVLRIDLAGTPTFRELLARVRDTTLGAYDHQELPFEKLVEDLQPRRNLGHAPLYQVEFVLQNITRPTVAIPGLTVTYVDLERTTAKCDLTLEIEETSGSFRAVFEYDVELFRGETVAQLATHFERLLEVATADPDRQLSDLPLLTADEERRDVEARRRTDAARPDVCVHELFEVQARRTPEADAVRFGPDRLSYGELNQRANQLARRLRRMGVGPEDRVAIAVERSLEMAVAVLGVLKAGASYLPLDPGYPRERLALMLADAGACVRVTQRMFRGFFAGGGPVVYLDDAEALAGESGDDLQGVANPANLAYVIYTSGSSGVPKGVMVTHRSLVAYSLDLVQELGLGPGDRVLQFASLSFDVSVEELLPAWISGAAVVLEDRRRLASTRELLGVLGREGITVTELPTAYWHEWVDGLAASRASLPACLRLVLIGGEKATAERVAIWQGLGVPLVNVYGVTEATVTSTLYPVPPGAMRGPQVYHSLPIGTPLPHTEVHVLDASLNLVPAGAPGELCIGGTCLARGYLGRGDLVAERFVPHPFSAEPGARLYRTGDRARRLRDGTLEFLGRMDNQLKIRGFRVEPGEIESNLKQVDGIQDAVVVARGPAALADPLLEKLLAVSPEHAARLLTDVEGVTDDEAAHRLALSEVAQADEEVKGRRLREFDVSLTFHDPGFIRPPRANQRDWLIRRALDDFAADLRQLDEASRRMIRGGERLPLVRPWRTSEAEYGEHELVIQGQQVMQDWERPLMKAMAEVVAEAHGDVLEVGFGMGISATYIQAQGVRSYTVIEPNDGVIARFEDWKRSHAGRDIRLVRGRWQDVVGQLGTFDGILFDTVPGSEEEYAREVIDSVVMAEDIFADAARLLRSGGVFTWYTNEIESFSRRHQKLAFNYFRSLTLTVVKPLRPPDDCHYWWADSMVVAKAVK